MIDKNALVISVAGAVELMISRETLEESQCDIEGYEPIASITIDHVDDDGECTNSSQYLDIDECRAIVENLSKRIAEVENNNNTYVT